MPLNLKNNYFTRHPLMAVFLFTFICLLPSMLMRDFTPSNELRYLSIADEALSGGHVFAFYNHGIPYADKPPLYLWIVMLCRVLFGHHSVLALSMFSLIPAFVTVWLMDRWVMSEASSSDRMAMAMMLLTCVMFLGTAVVLRMDMLMCMFIVLALFTFWRMYELRQDGEPEGEDAAVYRKCSWLLPVWIFLALFTKGPVGLLVPPVSILVFLLVERKGRDISRYLGWKTWGVIAGLCALWFSGVLADGGVSYLDNLLFKQTVGRAVNAFTHSRPFWFYAVAVLWCIAPYTLLLAGSLVLSVLPVRRKDNMSAEDVRSGRETLFLCVIVSTFVMLSSFSSKLPVYLVPIFPFVVYLFPLAINRRGCGRWMAWAAGIPAAVLVIAGCAAVAVLAGIVNVEAVASMHQEYPFVFTGPVKIAAVLLLAGNILALWFILRRHLWNLPVFLTGSSLLLMLYSASGVLPQANAYIGYGEICKDVPGGTDVATLFMHRPENIDIYLDGRQVADYGKDVDAFLSAAEDTLRSRPLTLITVESRLDEYPELKEFVYGAGPVAFSGPYCTVTALPGASHPAKSDAAPSGATKIGD